MNSRNATIGLLAVALLMFVSVDASASPSTWVVDEVKATYDDVPTDGALVFSGYATGLISAHNAGQFTEVTVEDNEGHAVSGTTEVLLSEGEGTCCAVLLVVWRPDSPLAANATYDGEIAVASIDRDDLSPLWDDATTRAFTVHTVDSTDTSLSGVRLEDVTANVFEQGVENECCQTKQGCAVGASTCPHCWDSVTRRAVHISARVVVDGGIAPWKVGFDEQYEGRDTSGLRWLAVDDQAHLYPSESDSKPYCFSVDAENLMNGHRVTSDTVCVEAPDAELGEQTAPRPERCVDEADSDAGTGSDAGADAVTMDAVDDAEEDASTDSEPEGTGAGCTQAGRKTPGAPLAAVFFAWLILGWTRSSRD